MIGTKLDLPETEGRLAELVASLPGETVYGISVFSAEGLPAVSEAFLRFVLDGEKLTGAPDIWGQTRPEPAVDES